MMGMFGMWIGMMGMFGMWIGMMGMWLIFLFIAFAVYQDAEKRGRSDGLMWLILLLIPWMNFIVLIVYLVVREEGSGITVKTRSPFSLLENRYARGEISREEYFQIKEDILKGV